jgi:hypothetical protein
VLDWAVEDVLGVLVSDVLLLWIPGIRITETKQTLKLEMIGVHDQHSHIGGKMHAHRSAPGVGGFSRPESEGPANDESGGWSSIYFSVSSL